MAGQGTKAQDAENCSSCIMKANGAMMKTHVILAMTGCVLSFLEGALFAGDHGACDAAGRRQQLQQLQQDPG